MKRVIISIILFVIYGNLFSQIEKTINCDFKYEITSSGKTNKCKLICLIPQDIDNTQKIRSINYSIQPDTIFNKNGNKYAEFIINNPSRKEKIIISVTLNLYINDLATNIEKIGSLKDSIFDFLNSEEFIEKDNENIKLKALELKGSEIEQTIENIFLFVNQKINYTGYNPNDIGAIKALKLKGGDCSEFSDLFVALCRSNNIPARVIDGLIIDYGITPKHVWTEVYINKYGWVRFDPTPGNSSTFETMKNRYIQLSIDRNDKILNNFHYWAYWYWGDPVEVNDYFEIKQ